MCVFVCVGGERESQTGSIPKLLCCIPKRVPAICVPVEKQLPQKASFSVVFNPFFNCYSETISKGDLELFILKY